MFTYVASDGVNSSNEASVIVWIDLTADADADGFPDWKEAESGTRSDNPDTDDDGYTDGEDPHPLLSLTGGMALDFDGADDYAVLTDEPAFDFDTAMTVECWFKVDNFRRDWQALVTKGDSAWRVHRYGDTGQVAFGTTSSGAGNDLASVTNVEDKKWHHVAAVYDGTDKFLYIDGVLENTETIAPMDQNDAAVWVGNNSEQPTRWFNGQMDELRIWNVARTGEDIRDNMHRELDGDEAGLVAYYPIGETPDTDLDDHGTNARHGILTNMDPATARVVSGIPCAPAIADKFQLRAAWSARNAPSAASSILSLSDDDIDAVKKDAFAAFGHDNGDLVMTDAVSKPAQCLARIGRVWRFAVSQALTGEMIFDCTGITGIFDSDNLCVLSDDDGDFANATVHGGTYADGIFAVTEQAYLNDAYYTLGEVVYPAEVTMAVLAAVTGTTAEINGEVTADNHHPVTARGVCWNTAGSPTTADSHTTDGAGVGAYTSTLAGLTPGTTYYARTYATSIGGTAYGEQIVFTTGGLTAPGNALDFDGDDDFGVLPDEAAFDGTTAITVECWFKADGFTKVWQALVTKGDTSWRLHRYGDTGQLSFGITTDTGNHDLTSATSVDDGIWHHAAAVYDGIEARLYIDGRLEKSQSVSGINQNSAPVWLGGNSQQPGRLFDGRMDELRIWNVARTEDDIRDNMHRELSGTEADLVAYYPMNQNGTAILDDFTANHHEGTLHNSPAWVAGTIPCASLITAHDDLRAAWMAHNSPTYPSAPLWLTNSDVSGTEFVVFGHDGDPLVMSEGIDKPADASSRLERTWRFESSGDVIGDPVFDCSDVAGSVNGYAVRLFVDDDGDFSDAEVIAGDYDFDTDLFTVSAHTFQDKGYYTIGQLGWLPDVTTSEVSEIYETRTRAGGNITYDGGLPVTDFGVCWNTTGNPGMTDNIVNGTGGGTGVFECDITGLDPETTYYVRAFVTNGAGTVFGDEVSFTTLEDTLWAEAFADGGTRQTWSFHFSGIDINDTDHNHVAITHEKGMAITIQSNGPEAHRTVFVDGTDYADAVIRARIREVSTGVPFHAYLLLRTQGGENGYLFGITDAGEIFIARRTGDADTVLASATLPSSDPAGCMLKFAAVGDQLSGKAWDDGTDEPCAWQLSVTDTAYTSGDAGIGVSAPPGGTSSAAFDDVALVSYLNALPIIYVNADATGAENGTDWTNAFTRLQDGLAVASRCAEIWVAEGTYHPDEGSRQTDDYRGATFALKSGVALYGGFEGTETERTQRDWRTHAPLLSGDLNGDDAGFANNDENAWHVVTGSGTDSSAVLDGVVITGGNADGSSFDSGGGGMLNDSGSPTLSNIIFRQNAAKAIGGGMLNLFGNPELTNVAFQGNIIDGDEGAGGGMVNAYANPTLSNVVFSLNAVAFGYGGGMANTGSHPLLSNVTFAGNIATMGGGMYNEASNPMVQNCIFHGDTAVSDGQEITNDANSSPAVTYSLVQGGCTGDGNIDAAPLFLRLPSPGNDGILRTEDDDYGDLRLQPGSPAVDAGNNPAVPAGITADLVGNPRRVDVPTVPDTGNGTAPIVDMGAYETVLAPGMQGDINGDERVDLADLIAGLKLLARIEPSGADARADIDADWRIGLPEVLYVLRQLGER